MSSITILNDTQLSAVADASLLYAQTSLLPVYLMESFCLGKNISLLFGMLSLIFCIDKDFLASRSSLVSIQ
jgi:hypothetical protein